jgi:glycosyltransferase involved in cell wall biosynthesis
MESSTPLVTVIIATYNRAETLKYAIESVLWQTYKNFELWVIGDCCTDHTETIVRSFGSDHRVNWYNLPQNSGYQSKPNNEGIRRAKGELIAYLNHDDIWLPNHLEDTVSHLQKTDSDIVFSIIQWVYSFTTSRPDIPLLPSLPIPPEATAVVHRKGIVNTIGYWKNIHETYSYPRVDFFRQAQFAGLKFSLAPSLTGLKFLWDEKSYHDVGPHPYYMRRLKTEKDYAVKELTAMLINAEHVIYSLPNKKRILFMLFAPLRKLMLKLKIDPASLRFWHRKGTQIRIWRKRHGLKAIVKEKPASENLQNEILQVKKSPSIQG